MGCFSFLCKKCGRPINSDSRSGQRCTLYLLENGKVIEQMTGQYNSYGLVFEEEKKSAHWNSNDWHEICNLMFDNDPSNGIAAVHERCRTKKPPTTQSEGDPNQGWGYYKKSYDYSFERKVFNDEF